MARCIFLLKLYFCFLIESVNLNSLALKVTNFIALMKSMCTNHFQYVVVDTLLHLPAFSLFSCRQTEIGSCPRFSSTGMGVRSGSISFFVDKNSGLEGTDRLR